VTGFAITGESLEHHGGQTPTARLRMLPKPSQVKAMSPASDVWSLGSTLVESMTQNLPVARAANQPEPLVPLTLPEPFLDIARHCLLRDPQERWTVVPDRGPVAGTAVQRPSWRTAAPAHAPARPPQPTLRDRQVPPTEAPQLRYSSHSRRLSCCSSQSWPGRAISPPSAGDTGSGGRA